MCLLIIEFSILLFASDVPFLIPHKLNVNPVTSTQDLQQKLYETLNTVLDLRLILSNPSFPQLPHPLRRGGPDLVSCASPRLRLSSYHGRSYTLVGLHGP